MNQSLLAVKRTNIEKLRQVAIQIYLAFEWNPKTLCTTTSKCSLCICTEVTPFTTSRNGILTSFFLKGKINIMIQYMQDFSMEKFESSCGIHFIFRWAVAYARARSSPTIVAASALAGGLAIAYALKRNNGNQPQDSPRRVNPLPRTHPCHNLNVVCIPSQIVKSHYFVHYSIPLLNFAPSVHKRSPGSTLCSSQVITFDKIRLSPIQS